MTESLGRVYDLEELISKSKRLEVVEGRYLESIKEIGRLRQIIQGLQGIIDELNAKQKSDLGWKQG